MQDKPDATLLLNALSALLKKEIAPALDGRLALQARIAANCIDIIQRELVHTVEDQARERASLEALLGHGGSLEALNRELAARISDGEFGVDHPGLMDHLWRATLRKVRIDQPRYATFLAMSDEQKASYGL